jgi:hypothetical protein
MSVGDWLPIGHGVYVQFRRMAVDGTEPIDSARAIVGLAYRHPDAKGRGDCEGWVPFKGLYMPGTDIGWDVFSISPLTLSPSLLCRICGHHGFIRGGEWLPA